MFSFPLIKRHFRNMHEICALQAFVDTQPPSPLLLPQFFQSLSLSIIHIAFNSALKLSYRGNEVWEDNKGFARLPLVNRAHKATLRFMESEKRSAHTRDANTH